MSGRGLCGRGGAQAALLGPESESSPTPGLAQLTGGGPLSAGAWDVQRLRSSSLSLCCREKPGGRQGQASETKALPWLPARKPTPTGEGRV